MAERKPMMPLLLLLFLNASHATAATGAPVCIPGGKIPQRREWPQRVLGSA